jgi:hypothetical protein
MAAQSYFDSIASVLSGIARRHGMEPKLLEHKLLKNWPEIAGEQVAAHTRPDQIKFKKLYLIAESSVWIQHLTFLKPELIEKINAAAGRSLITDVVLRVGTVPRKEDVRGSRFDVEPGTPPPELRTSNFELSADLLKEAEAHTVAVTDPGLRAKLTDMIAQALNRQRTPSKR